MDMSSDSSSDTADKLLIFPYTSYLKNKSLTPTDFLHFSFSNSSPQGAQTFHRIGKKSRFSPFSPLEWVNTAIIPVY